VPKLASSSPGHYNRTGAKMERIYDSLQRITQLWKKLELTKADTSEYDAIMDQIRVLSEEYKALIDAPKKPTEAK
jgi:hypothetical protein